MFFYDCTVSIKGTIKVITKISIIQYLLLHEKNHHNYHFCNTDTYLEKFFKWRMYHGVWNKRQSIEREKLCRLAQCSSFCFQVCLKMRNPFLKFTFVLRNKAAYFFRKLPLWMHCKAGKYKQRPKCIHIKFESPEYLLSKKQCLFN